MDIKNGIGTLVLLTFSVSAPTFSMERVQKRKTVTGSAVVVETKKVADKILVTLNVGLQERVFITHKIADAIEQLGIEGKKYDNSIDIYLDLNFKCVKLDRLSAQQLLKLAEKYQEGKTVTRESIVAREIFEMLEGLSTDPVEQAAAKINLAQMYLYGRGGLVIDKHRAWNYFLQVTEQQHNLPAQAAAYQFWGEMYYYGDGVEKDELFAVECFRKAKDQPDTGAMIRAWLFMGLIYYFGKANEKANLERAIWYFNKAYVQNHDSVTKARAAACMAQANYLSPSTISNTILLFEWVLKQTDSKARAYALLWLGRLLAIDKAGMPNDQKRGMELLRQAKDQNDNLVVKEAASKVLEGLSIGRVKQNDKLWLDVFASF